jgi:hypothetical protein
MLNSHLVSRLTAIQQALLAQRAAGVGLPAAVAGGERETFMREYLQRIFPAHRRFASGVITDADGQLSGQVDIAVEFGLSPSFPMPASEQRLILAEGTAMVIEVKSDLTRQWNEVESTTRAVKKLRREIGALMTIGEGPPVAIPVVAVGYHGHATSDNLEQRLASTDPDCRPDGALAIDSGAFVGFGMKASGALGLFALAISIDGLLAQLLLARPDLTRYVR